MFSYSTVVTDIVLVFLNTFYIKCEFSVQCVTLMFTLSSTQVRGQENGLDGGKAGIAGRGAERGRRGRGRGRGTVGK